MKAFGDANILRSALIATANGVLITDREGTIVWVNPAFEKMTGFSFREVRGQNPRILKSGKHDIGFYRNLWDTVLSGNVWSGEIVNKKKDGSLYIDIQTITPFPDTSGTISYFISVKQDVTQYRLMEQEKEESLAMFHAIFNYSLDAILFTIPDGRIIRANWAACKLFQMEEEELITAGAKGILDFSDPNLASGLEERARTGRFLGTLRFKRKDGSLFSAELASNIFHLGSELRTAMMIRPLPENR